MITLPKGSAFDLKALAQCSTPSATVVEDGLSACPASTKLGTGSAKVFLGSATIDAGVTLFNHKHGFLFVLTTGDTVLRTVDAVVKGRIIDAKLPKKGSWTLRYVPTFNSDYGFETLTAKSACG